jgi:hypothetical protein
MRVSDEYSSLLSPPEHVKTPEVHTAGRVGINPCGLLSRPDALEPKSWQPSLQCLCFQSSPARSSSSILSIQKTDQVSAQPLSHSAQEVLCFNLYLSGDIGIMIILKHDLPCGDFSCVFGPETAHH